MFSIRLKELRDKNNLSQKEFAKILNVSTGTVGNWEVGLREPDFKMLIKIADIFNVSCDYMLGRFSGGDGDEEKLKNVAVTPVEEEMLSQFRSLGKKLGGEGQNSIISIVKILNEKIKDI